MIKKLTCVILALVLALACFAGCTKPTEEPTPTEAPTEAPTEVPTEAPTEEPTAVPEPTEEPTATPEPIQVLDVDAVLTDMASDVDVAVFTKNAADFDNLGTYAVVTGTGAADGAYVSLRPYDMRKIDAVLEEDPSMDRTLADATKYGIFALKYKVEEGVVMSTWDFCNTTWDTNIPSAPDTIPYDSKPFIADGQWHIMIINIKEEMPNAYALGEKGDMFDCFVVPAPAEEDDEYLIAWYGCFLSEEDVNAWDANYNLRFPSDMK